MEKFMGWQRVSREMLHRETTARVGVDGRSGEPRTGLGQAIGPSAR